MPVSRGIGLQGHPSSTVVGYEAWVLFQKPVAVRSAARVESSRLILEEHAAAVDVMKDRLPAMLAFEGGGTAC